MVSLRFRKEDDEVIESIRQTLGVQSATEIVRMAIRVFAASIKPASVSKIIKPPRKRAKAKPRRRAGK